ncbi:MAG: hypothetical protein ACSHXK_12295 [Oceanococcus sp.]
MQGRKVIHGWVLLALLLLSACQGGRELNNGQRNDDAPTAAPRTDKAALAGVAVVDASWHFGASAGQFAGTGVGIADGRGFDPYGHAVRKVGSDILGSRITTRALVVQGSNDKVLAIVANDLYLPNDLLRRRVAQLLVAEGSTGIGIDNLAMTVSHSHTSPFYSTPAIGPWVFQDVMDLRFFEYMAQRMSDAIVQAHSNMRPATMGGAAFYANDIRAHTYGPKISPDGSPAGQPHDYTTRQAYVLRFDDADSGENFANWVVLGVHPEWVWGEEIMNGDVTHAVMRMLDRETGAVTVMSQSETGTSGPHKDERAHKGPERREFQESNLAGTDRAARLFADNVHSALTGITESKPWDATQFVAMQSEFDVNYAHQRFAPPASRPYPGVSNCNMDQLYYNLNPGVPIVGFPDCQFPLEEVVEPFAALGPVSPQALLGTLSDQLLGLGVPLPTSLSGPSLLLLEEQDVVPIQSFKLGDVALTFCPCEQFTDTALNIISRLNKVAQDVHTGWDWDKGYPNDLRNPSLNNDLDNSQDHGCWQSGEDEWSCPHPHQYNDEVLTMTAAVFERMQAQIHNDAAGWDELENLAFMESEPTDPAEIKGNFTHEEHTEYGYGLVIPVGMANDYWGYMPAYREYRAHDHYRKALAGLGPHGADFLATRLSRLAASLNGHPGQPLNVLDTAFAVESARAEIIAQALGSLAQTVTPVYESILPNDGGSPAIVEQPTAQMGRFNAAHVKWVGGSSYEGFPKVVVERQVGDDWRLAGTMDGEIQLHLQFPAATRISDEEGGFSIPDIAELVQWASGGFEWVWTANFEVFASELPLPLPTADQRPQQAFVTPSGVYRFRIQGEHRGQGGYELTSDSFTVQNQAPITVEQLQLNGNALAFNIGPVNSYTVFTDGGPHDRGTVEVEAPWVFGPIDYPDSYTAAMPWIREERNLHRYQEGAQDDQVYCHHCTFRPWLSVGEPAQVCASWQRDGVVLERICSQDSASAYQLEFSASPLPGDVVGVLRGDAQDRLGQGNQADFLLTVE